MISCACSHLCNAPGGGCTLWCRRRSRQCNRQVRICVGKFKMSLRGHILRSASIHVAMSVDPHCYVEGAACGGNVGNSARRAAKCGEIRRRCPSTQRYSRRARARTRALRRGRTSTDPAQSSGDERIHQSTDNPNIHVVDLQPIYGRKRQGRKKAPSKWHGISASGRS